MKNEIKEFKKSLEDKECLGVLIKVVAEPHFANNFKNKYNTKTLNAFILLNHRLAKRYNEINQVIDWECDGIMDDIKNELKKILKIK